MGLGKFLSKMPSPLFIIIFKLKNDNFKTRDFSLLIERVLAGVTSISFKSCPKKQNISCSIMKNFQKILPKLSISANYNQI